jgi:mannose-6-phosphate isomerase-like protein (cupin superfamily)
MSYQINIINKTKENGFFRDTLFTGAKSQLVVMSIPPGGEIGEEVHDHVEQTLFFLSGSGQAVLNGVETPIVAGDAVVVTPGTRHNFLNTGAEDLKVYTVYAPPNHLDGRRHVTKTEADADEEDEAFGHAVR